MKKDLEVQRDSISEGKTTQACNEIFSSRRYWNIWRDYNWNELIDYNWNADEKLEATFPKVDLSPCGCVCIYGYFVLRFKLYSCPILFHTLHIFLPFNKNYYYYYNNISSQIIANINRTYNNTEHTHVHITLSSEGESVGQNHLQKQ